MDYFEKIEKKPSTDLDWNIPEQKQGIINIIGGNSQSFRNEVKIAEFLTNMYPIKTVNVILPEALRSKLPMMPNFVFLPATESGSFAESQGFLDIFNNSDYNLMLGDFSKNAITGRAVASACQHSEKMTLITRDAVDLLADNKPERTLMNENLVFFASVAQLQKLLRAVYYPKMLMISQSLVQVADVLHKFTLSYPISIITLHNGQILIAQNGLVKAVPLEQTNHTPITIWLGESAAKITALNLYNPQNFLSATIAAIM